MNNNDASAPLPEEIRKALGETLPRDKVKYREQAGENLAYVDGHYVTERLNDVFGHRWSFTHAPAAEIARYERETKKGKNLVVMYEVQGRLEVLGCIVRQDVGVGVCDARADNPSTGIEKARKEAVTDALKRCAKSLGASFGLALYDKARANVGISTTATNLLGEIDELESAEAIKSWIDATAPKRAKLDEDETAILHGAVVARRRALRTSSSSVPGAGGAPANDPPAEAPAPAPAPAPAFKPSPSVQLALARLAMARSSRTVAATVLACDARGTAAAPVDAAVAAARARGVDLGDLETKIGQGRNLNLALAVWNSAAEVLAAIDAAQTAEALNGVRTRHAVLVKELPEVLRAGVKTASDARAAELGAETVASRLLAKAKAATDIETRKKVYAELAEAAKGRRVSPDDAKAITAVLNGTTEEAAA